MSRLALSVCEWACVPSDRSGAGRVGRSRGHVRKLHQLDGSGRQELQRIGEASRCLRRARSEQRRKRQGHLLDVGRIRPWRSTRLPMQRPPLRCSFRSARSEIYLHQVTRLPRRRKLACNRIDRDPALRPRNGSGRPDAKAVAVGIAQHDVATPRVVLDLDAEIVAIASTSSTRRYTSVPGRASPSC